MWLEMKNAERSKNSEVKLRRMLQGQLALKEHTVEYNIKYSTRSVLYCNVSSGHFSLHTRSTAYSQFTRRCAIQHPASSIQAISTPPATLLPFHPLISADRS